jgi:hypothetical protein
MMGIINVDPLRAAVQPTRARTSFFSLLDDGFGYCH